MLQSFRTSVQTYDDSVFTLGGSSNALTCITSTVYMFETLDNLLLKYI